MQVQQLNLFPIKSTQAYSVAQAVVLPQGLNFDREFMLTERDGRFITARQDAALFELSAFPIPMGLMIYHRSGESCLVRYQDFVESGVSEVWGNIFVSKIASQAVNSWLEKWIGRPVQLRWLGEKSERSVMNFPESPMSFADSNPILLTSMASLSAVQDWVKSPITMERFRSNIVIDGDIAFAEEQWQRIQIGGVRLIKSQLCTRCILTARDPQSLEMHARLEPFRSLKQYHTNEKGKPIFGVHFVPENSGVIAVNDLVQVLA